MTKGDSGSYTIRDTKNNEDIQIYDVFVEEKPGFPVWVIVLILILLCCCIGAVIFLLYKQRMRKQLERRQQQVDLLVQEAEGGTEEKIREVETSLNQLQQQYNNTVYEDKVKVFCSDKRRQLLKRRQQQVDQLVQDAVGGTEEKIREVETSVDQLQEQYNKTVYEDNVKLFCSEKRRQLLMWRQQLVDQFVQEALGGTEEKIREAEKTVDQLQQQYNNTVYEDKVKVFCSEKRRQLLERRLQLVDQLVQEAEGGTEEKIREAEKTLDQLQQQYNNTVYKDKVKVFCSEKRRQLFEGHLKQVDQLVQEALVGTEEKEEKIREVDETLKQLQQKYNTVYELQVTVFCRKKRRQLLNTLMLPLVKPVQKNKGWKKEYTDDVHHMLNCLKDLYRNTKYADEVTVFCMKQRSQMNWWRLQYSDDDIDKTRRETLNRKLLHVRQLVQQAEAGKEEKITEAKKAIDELEKQYNYTEYSEHVSMLCYVKRIQLIPLYSNKGLIPQDTELNRKLLHVEQLVQQAKAGKEEEITEAKSMIDELEKQYSYTEYSEHVSVLCDVKRIQLIPLYSDKGLITPDTELDSRVDHVEKFVQQAKGGTEKISKVEEKISELELDYFTTEYSGRVSWFCMTKRAELYWYRLPHSENK